MIKVNKYIDHTLLKPDATKEQIELLCSEADKYKFATVCVNQYYVPLAKQLLKKSEVEVCTTIGFPLGQSPTDVKVAETKSALVNGADEIDMVMNIAAIKNKDYDYVLEDMRQVKIATGAKVLKVILETCLLTDEEIKKACELALQAKADFVKTSTGFSTGGATTHSVKIMHDICEGKALVKASGGVKNANDAIAMIEAGASRIGTSSGVEIVRGETSDKDY